MLDLPHHARNHAILRDRLKDAYGLEDGDEALIDTLDGESDFKSLALSALRKAKEREALAVALSSMIADMQARKRRIEEGADRLRAIVADAMLDAGESKIPAPDMTVSVRMGRPKVIIDEARLPECFKEVVQTTKVNKAAVQESVDKGDVPEGVTVANPIPVLTVRVK